MGEREDRLIKGTDLKNLEPSTMIYLAYYIVFFFHYSKSSIFRFIHKKGDRGPNFETRSYASIEYYIHPLQQHYTNYGFCTSPLLLGLPKKKTD
jgi:hypothetical protein